MPRTSPLLPVTVRIIITPIVVVAVIGIIVVIIVFRAVLFQLKSVVVESIGERRTR